MGTYSDRIVQENQLPGSPKSEWDVPGAGSTNIQGFATNMSVNVGGKVDFKIKTNSTNYRIDIYRLGYYGGLGARKVSTIQRTLSSAQAQPNPRTDSATGLVDAGNWSVSASWTVPTTAVSGVYIAKLVRQDGVSGASLIPFIVRDDNSQSDIIFQTSDTTWQAYNSWGGNSLYTGSPAGRAYKVSYNRPFITRGDPTGQGGPRDFLFDSEYPMIRWLEQNGYGVSYLSGIDTDRLGAELREHKAFLSVGHDEYWSGQQRANVEAARDAGVNLAFFSGNEVFWKTRWENSIDGSNTPYRTLVSYKETHANAKIDPNPAWTGTWRDPRFSPPSDGGRPENQLTGTIFTVNNGSQETIQVPGSYGNLRFWRNTSIAGMSPSQTATLSGELLSYEWDEDLDNGFRPPGLINLSSTSDPSTSYLLDYGSTYGSRAATHNLSLYRDDSGALVFGAGTPRWAWGLDGTHDYDMAHGGSVAAAVPDVRVQQSTANLLADMGVLTDTLQAGLVRPIPSTDTTKPASTIVTPSNGSTLTGGQSVTITGTATDVGGVVGGVEVSTDGGTTWRRAAGRSSWSYSWTPTAGGTYTIRSRAVDDSVNMETPGAGVQVTVSNPTTASLFSSTDTPAVITDPERNALELGVRFSSSAAGEIIGVKFYKGPQNTGTHIGSLWSSTGTRLAQATFTNETASGWQAVTFAAPVKITAGTTYVASYSTNGGYSADSNYFTAPHTSGPLTAPVNAGVYAYGQSGTFPTSTYNASNYWVDTIFRQSTSTANSPPTAVNDSATTTKNTAVTIQGSDLTRNDSDPDNDPLTITGVSNPSNGMVSLNQQAVTFTPAMNYVGSAGFQYSISDGRGGTSTATVSVNVTDPGTTTTAGLFSPNATPTIITDPERSALELGVRFSSSAAGEITGIEFYKGPQNTGTHIGSLWSSTGTRLAQGTFTNETASGWQTLTFTTPVKITAGTTYVASYSTNGSYSADLNYFTAPYTSGPLTAPVNAGVYAYGQSGTFPTSTYNASNYWVDVNFRQLAA
ncbi:DUF4082 domain-containing protein [Microvirga massiliensis]|uniref:DUF4082 domain-containing protein n=1 Tax=Microvirga massiliensis TaxID=1033741 RepID=UPI00062B86C4|nr:DUF4082 domain-containing protein [Microvirga massiliensis]